MKVHFICRGNVFRSLIAESYFNSLHLPDIKAISSGTMADARREFNLEYFERTKVLLAQHGVSPLSKDGATQLNQQRLDSHDITICMNDPVYEEARAIVDLPAHTRIWHVEDIGEGKRVDLSQGRGPHEESGFQEIKSLVDNLVQELASTTAPA